jgi:hypothetical protein
MPVNDENYSHRGGGNYGIVLICPNVVGTAWCTSTTIENAVVG